jgi:hypothetical protein
MLFFKYYKTFVNPFFSCIWCDFFYKLDVESDAALVVKAFFEAVMVTWVMGDRDAAMNLHWLEAEQTLMYFELVYCLSFLK